MGLFRIAFMASPERCLQILAGVKQQSDRFLDPSRLFASARTSPSPSAKRARQASPARSDRGEGASLRIKQMDLCSELGLLRAQLEEAKEEVHQQQRLAQLQKGRESGSVARLEQRIEHLEIERKSAIERTSAAERKLLNVEAERDNLKVEKAEVQVAARQAEEQLQRIQADSSKRIDELTAESAAALEASKASEVPSARDAEGAALREEAEALRSRILELEGEVRALHVSLEEGAPDRELSAQLQAHHKKYTEELKVAEAVRQELVAVREKAVRLEQEGTRLKAALAASTTALEEAEAAVRVAGPLKHDLESFSSAAKAIVAEVDIRKRGAAAMVSPMDLSMAWAKLQTELSSSRRTCAQARQEADGASEKQRSGMLELGKAQAALVKAQGDVEELQMELRRERDEVAAQQARAQVLRDAMTKATRGDPASAGSLAENANVKLLKEQLEASKKKCDQLGSLLQARKRETEKVNQRMEALQGDGIRVAELEAKVRQFERVNVELWASSRELEQQQERMLAEMEEQEAQMAARASQQGDLPSQTSCSGPERPGLQLDRFRKATRKHVQDFREGIYGLLGWRVEMKEEDCAMCWHLKSRFSDKELVFRLRPAELGRGAEFDLLGTPWAERLLEDRHAMAYLEAHGSVPGFLAAITTELLAQKMT